MEPLSKPLWKTQDGHWISQYFPIGYIERHKGEIFSGYWLWRLRCVVYKLENQESPWYNQVWVQRPETQELRCPMSKDRRRWKPPLNKREFGLLLTLCSLLGLSGSGDAHHIGNGRPLYSVYRYKRQSLPEGLPQTYPEIIFYQLTGHPLAQSQGLIKLTITVTVLAFPREGLECSKLWAPSLCSCLCFSLVPSHRN